MLTFGNITLKHGLFLAPLAGYTDRAFRTVCRALGAEFQTTEMVSSRALCYHDKKTPLLARIDQEELPASVQIFGSEPSFMAEAAAMVAEGMAGGAVPSAVDINMGCPVKKIVSAGDGSALLRKPELAFDIVKAVKRAISLPVTVKIRVGFGKEDRGVGIPAFAKALEEAGASLLAVHGRTRADMYSVEVDLASIAAVKSAVSIPVVGNGDIKCAADAVTMLRETGCDGVMIGRGAIGNPFIFAQIAAALEGRAYTPPTLREKMVVALWQLRLAASEKGEYTAVVESRKQFAAYTSGVRGASALRGRMNAITTIAEAEALCRELLQNSEA